MYETEPRRLSDTSFELLDRVAARIRPDERRLDAWFDGYYREHRTRFAGDLRLVERYVARGGRILESGAIPLVMTAALSALEYDVTALDLRPERFAGAIAQLGLNVARCDIENEPVPCADGVFDAVLFSEVFEHLRINPVFTMREVRRVLKPGGLLLLSTPNLRSWRGVRNFLVHNRAHTTEGGVYAQYEKLETVGHMGHVREYTTREVADFLTAVGFRVETLIYRGGYGRGATGFAEWLMPSLRPFFTVVAVNPAPSIGATPSGSTV